MRKRRRSVAGYVLIPGLNWFASYPYHYSGDGKFGTEEKGKVLLEIMSERVADIIRVVKKDSNTEEIKQEFFKLSQQWNSSS